MDSTATRPWERPWTTDEMRQHSANWTLAGDAGLLKHLQQFSQNLLARTHSTTQKMDTLFEDLRNTETEVNNVTNSFLSLSNTQFVESRVYEDEDKETPKEDTKLQELSREQKQAEVVAHVSEALSLGMSVLDTMFNVVQVSGSDSEDEESLTSSVHTILEPKNPYLNRPLPYLIGSKEFMEDDQIGLGDPSSITEDNVSLGPTHSSDSEQDAMPDRIASSSSECSDLESDQGVRRHPESLFTPVTAESVRRPGSLFDDSEETGDMFGRKSPHDASPPTQVKPRGQASFAEELAAKLGGVAAQDEESQPEKTSQPGRVPSKLADDLFSPGDDDEDSLFGGSGGKFSAKSGLFDDFDEPSKPTWKGDEKKVPAKPASQSASLFSDDLFNASEQDSDDIFSVAATKKPVVKVVEHGSGGGDKKPPGGVSIFGKDLFGTTDNLRDAPKKRLLSVPESKGGIFTSTPDSDKNEDSDGLFGPRVTQNVSDIKTSESLFANVDEDDLFSPSSSKAQPKTVKSVEPDTPTKKLPAGAVSIFGQDLFAKVSPLGDSKSLSKSPRDQDSLPESNGSSNTVSDDTLNRSFIQVSSDSGNSLGQASGSRSLEGFKSNVDEESLFNPVLSSTRRKSSVNSATDQNSASGLFKEEFTSDSLFQKSRGALGKSATTSNLAASKTINRKPVSLFDSDSDESDLFSRTSSPSIRSVDRVEQDKQPLQKKSLFANDEQLFKTRSNEPNFDIFGTTRADKSAESKPPVSQDKSTVSKTVAKTSLLGDNIDNIDIFSSRSTVKTTDSKNSNLFDFGDDTVDDIFAVPSTKAKASVNLAAGLFDGVEDLFAVPKSSKSISERLFEDLQSGSMFEDEPSSVFEGRDTKKGSSKPEPPTTLNIRKTTDLFSGSSKEDLFGLRDEKEKPDVQGSSSTKILEVGSVEKRNDDLFPKMEKNITDIFGSSNDSHVDNLFSNVAKESSNSVVVSEQRGSESVGKNTEVTKYGAEERVLQVPEPTAKSIKPQVTHKPEIKEAVIKTIGKPVIVPRLPQTSTDNVFQDALKEKPKVAVRSVSKISSDQLEPNIQALQEEKSRIAPRSTVSSGEEKQQALRFKGSKNEAGQVSEQSSIHERASIIDPTALLPGAQLPRGGQAERAVSFEEPMAATATLHSAAKERAKIPVKRRPQSRRARQEAIRSSAIFDDDSPPSPGGISEVLDDTMLRKSKSEPFKLEFQDKTAQNPKPNSKLFKENNKTPKGPVDTGSKQDSSPVSSPGESASEQPFGMKRNSPSSLFSPETDEGEDLFGMPQDLPDYDVKEDLGGNLFGGAPVLSPPGERPSLFQTSIPDKTVKDRDLLKNTSSIPKKDGISNVSRSSQLFEANNDSLFGSSSTIPKSSSSNLFSTDEIKSTINTESADIFSQIVTSDKKSESLFGNVSDRLFSSASSNVAPKSETVKATISKPLAFEDKEDLFAVDKMDKNYIEKDIIKAENIEDLFTSQTSLDSSSIFTSSKRHALTKAVGEEEDLFPVKSANNDFESDLGDSLFKNVPNALPPKTEKSSSSEAQERDLLVAKGTDTEPGSGIEDDLFGATSKSRTTRPSMQKQEGLSTETSGNVPALVGQQRDLFHAKSAEGAFETDSVENLFRTVGKPINARPAPSSAVEEEDLFSVKTTENNFESSAEDDLFGSVSAKPVVKVPISTTQEKDLFSVRVTDETLGINTEDSLFGSGNKSVSATNFKTTVTQTKSQTVATTAHKSPSLFDEGDLIEEDLFSAGRSNQSAVPSNIVTANEGTSVGLAAASLRKSVKKTLFEDDDDDDIFSSSAAKSSGKTSNKSGGLVGYKSSEKKPKLSKPTSTQNADFEDPLMALRRE